MLSDIARADVVDLDRWSLKVTRTPVPGAGGSTEDVSNGGGGKVRVVLFLVYLRQKSADLVISLSSKCVDISHMSLKNKCSLKTVVDFYKNKKTV